MTLCFSSSQVLSTSRTFFATTKTSIGRPLFQTERNALDDRESYLRYREYIAQNPVRAGLVDSPEKFPYCFIYLTKREAQGLKALDLGNGDGMA
jgi:hypothetical protein